MKWLIAAWLVLIVPAVHAVECGPLIQTDRVNQLHRAVQVLGMGLFPHIDSLQNEIDGLLRYSPTKATVEEVGRISIEQDFLIQANLSGENVETAVNAALVLATVRDFMVDKRDRVVVESYLSISASYVRSIAEIRTRYLNQLLTKMSRPGLAIDVSKLRDAIGMVLGEFQKCESPRVPSTGPQTRQ